MLGSFGGTIDSDGYINNSVNMTRALGDREAKFHEEKEFFSRGFAVVNTPEVSTLLARYLRKPKRIDAHREQYISRVV